MRPYTDLITEITVDGEMFIPIKQIAALAFAYKPECIEYQYNICHNPYFEEVHYLFSTRNGVDYISTNILTCLSILLSAIHK